MVYEFISDFGTIFPSESATTFYDFLVNPRFSRSKPAVHFLSTGCDRGLAEPLHPVAGVSVWKMPMKSMV